MDTLTSEISILMETVMMIKRTGFQSESETDQNNAANSMTKNRKL